MCRWEHGDTALMCLGTSQLGYSWILQPSTMPRAYLNFLNYHGGLPLHSYQAVRVRPSLLRAWHACIQAKI